jgi:hypothetical protein
MTLLSPPTIMMRHFAFVALHNGLLLARYLNHLYDSDMSSILILNNHLSQASKTLCLKELIFIVLVCKATA